MNCYELYTDGGCRGNGKGANVPAGIGYVLLENGDEILADKETCYFLPNTNNKAELYAAIKGLKYVDWIISTRTAKEVELTIYTDSAYTLNGITSWIKNWKKNGWKTSKNTDVLNKKLWQELNDVIERIESVGVHITWKKVKGHSGNTYNEKVDKLANEAMDEYQKGERYENYWSQWES